MCVTYAYAVVPSKGRYGSKDVVYASRSSNNLAKVTAKAKRMTTRFQKDGSSGGYRVVAYRRRWRGHELDRVADAN